jgi:two-component system response regulator RegX3
MIEVVRALVVDDEESICFTLKEALQRVGYVVTTASNGEGALEVLREHAFDVAVVDLNLGGEVDGLDVLEAIRWRWPDMAVVILTAHGSLDSAITAIRDGVDDYLLKPARPGEVRKAVERALERRKSAQALEGDRHKRVLQAGGFFMNLDQHTVTVDGRYVELTPQEFKLLAHLVQNAHRVVSPPELVRVARDYNPDSLDEARQIIKWYIHRLRKQVEPDPANPRHIVNIRGVGYRFEE